MSSRRPDPAELIARLYDDPEECARLAKLRYVHPDEPGMKRFRKGKGFSYRDVDGVTVVDVKIRDRITKLAIPPAWSNVWICTFDDGHILAVGDDERDRRQYIYHERWRSLRDQLNFYRLIGFGDGLPLIRADVEAQLRRRTLDRERVIATMLRVMDLTGLRIGNEVYAEENDSYGLSTITRKHLHFHGRAVDLVFPAKSGKTADVTVQDAGVVRVLATLAEQRSRRLFTIGGSAIESDEVNERLRELTGAHLTAKDFRTWIGTMTVFRHLRDHLPARGAAEGPSKGVIDEAHARKTAESHVLAAIGAASLKLGNTRSVARAHYVHPEIVDGYTSGELGTFLRRRKPRPAQHLAGDERLMLAYLTHCLAQRAGEFAA